jgi:hypothetical protein
MTTDQAKNIADELSDVFSDMLMELNSDDDILSLAEMIEDFFLGSYDLSSGEDYPDWEEVAVHVFTSQWEKVQELY